MFVCSGFKHEAHQPEKGDRKDADDEEDGVEDEHPGQSNLSSRQVAAYGRAGAPSCNLAKLRRRRCRRRYHHHHHHGVKTSAVDVNEEEVHELLIPKIKLTSNHHHHHPVAGRLVGADDVEASEDEKVQTNHHDEDGDDDGGHGGGPEHGLGAKGLQDAEASLAGYDGGQDFGNASQRV